MANEPLKRMLTTWVWASETLVAEMFMANEPLKHAPQQIVTLLDGQLQRCLWRMSH